MKQDKYYLAYEDGFRPIDTIITVTDTNVVVGYNVNDVELVTHGEVIAFFKKEDDKYIHLPMEEGLQEILDFLNEYGCIK